MKIVKKNYFIYFLLILFLVSFFSCTGKKDGEQVIGNLRAFAKLYGYVRFFHPSDEAARIDWERFALYGVEKVKNAGDSRQLKAVLEELFLPLAPTLQIYRAGETPGELELPANTKGLKVVAWQHKGVWLGNKFEGYRSIRLNRKNKLPTVSPTQPGIITEKLDAIPYRGKEIKLSAAIRAEVELPGVQGHMWLRVNKKEKQRTFYDGMKDYPIKSKKWKTYEINGTVDKEAETILFGCHLKGSGKLWVDHFQLAVKSESGQWTPVPLQNPGFETGDIDAAPPSWETDERPYFPRKLKERHYTFKVTTENPFDGEKCLLIESPYTFFDKEKLFDKYPQPGEYVDKKLDMELYCRVPLALYSNDSGTLGKNNRYPFQPLADAMDVIDGPFSGNREVVRLADVAIAWNIFQHFYPYFDVVTVDWDQQLTIALRSALADKDEKAFAYTLKRLLAAMKDNHATVSHHSLRGRKRLPLMLGWIENRVVVTASKDQQLKKGDIILAIDGTPAEQVLREEMEYISGSPQSRRFYGLYYTTVGPAGKKARLKIQRAGEIVEIDLERNHVGGWQSIPEFEHSPIEKIEEDIFYVDLNNAKMEEIDKKIKEIADARGVVFDLRGYPKGNFKVICYLLKEKDTAKWMFVPQIIYPDQENLVGYEAHGWELEPLEPHIKGKVVFLTDGRAMSAAESFMGFIEHYKLAEIVGQPTGGTNGNINPFELPGGYFFWWTGMRVLKQDGRQHHLIGVQPTVPMERTIKDVAEGRDTLLEKALEIIRRYKPNKEGDRQKNISLLSIPLLL